MYDAVFGIGDREAQAVRLLAPTFMVWVGGFTAGAALYSGNWPAGLLMSLAGAVMMAAYYLYNRDKTSRPRP